jgi:hypothetical protein
MGLPGDGIQVCIDMYDLSSFLVHLKMLSILGLYSLDVTINEL